MANLKLRRFGIAIRLDFLILRNGSIFPLPGNSAVLGSHLSMPVLQTSGGETKLIKPSEYNLEKDLEAVVAEYPSLIFPDGNIPVALVKRQLSLPSAGDLDVLLIDAAGLPICVEVKLARNGETRRQIVAQIVDYVSELTLLTADELDDRVGGKLREAVKSFDPNFLKGEFEATWQKVGVNLREANVRYVLVVDSAPEDLQRIIKFLSKTSELDIWLVEVSRYGDTPSEHTFVPNFLVQSSEDPNSPAGRKLTPDFEEVLREYSTLAAPDFDAKGRSAKYRLIRPEPWPWGIHYEFYRTSGCVGAEIHLEDDTVQPLATLVQSLIPSIQQKFSPEVVWWDPKWRGVGRLVVRLGEPSSPLAVAEAMQTLIGITRGQIEAELKRLGLYGKKCA